MRSLDSLQCIFRCIGRVSTSPAAGALRYCSPTTRLPKFTFASPPVDAEELERRLVEDKDTYTTVEAKAARMFWKNHAEQHQELFAGSNEGLDKFQQNGWRFTEIMRSSLRHMFPVRAARSYAIYSTLIVSLLEMRPGGSLRGFVDDSLAEGIVDQTIPTVVTSVVDNIGGCGDFLYACSIGPGDHPTAFLTTALFLILSFRVNRSMMRWWEGRTLFTKLQSQALSFTAAAQVYTCQRDVAAQIAIQAYAIVKATEYALRRVDDSAQLRFLGNIMGAQTDQLCGLASAHNRPLQVAAQLSAQLADAHDQNYIKNIRSTIALQDINHVMIGLVRQLSMIQNCTEPVTYQKHLRFTASAWLLLLPWAMAPALSVATVPVAAMVGFVVFKLENIATILQNPFGLHNSAVPICLHNEQLRKEILDMLLLYQRQDTGHVLDYDTHGDGRIQI